MELKHIADIKIRGLGDIRTELIRMLETKTNYVYYVNGLEIIVYEEVEEEND